MHVPSQPARAIAIDQTAAGFAALQHTLQAIESDPPAILMVMEATGTSWMRLASRLVAAGFAVAVINPAQAHDFAKALRKRSKTDATPAQTLAVLGARLQPACWAPPPQVYTELQQRLVHRDGLVAARTQFRNQLHALLQQPLVIASVRTRLESLIASLNEEMATVAQEIAAALQQDAAWAVAAARLATITGLGH